jgi:hypothetical protein
MIIVRLAGRLFRMTAGGKQQYNKDQEYPYKKKHQKPVQGRKIINFIDKG